MSDETVTITAHDDVPAAEGGLVDTGLGDHNEAAAPLHEVRRLSCFARAAGGEVVGGVVGRTWGAAAEIQQLWVAPAHRRRGLGARLVRAFEQHAHERGCRSFHVETFSFQAPRLYESLGYRTAFALSVYPHGVVRYTMVREASPETGGRQ
ncbi:amino-acid N-acetyltransferase [Burkholderiales bacterium]|nr:amino-acid N-acetyltransferase [Burkholderiales bacterium]